MRFTLRRGSARWASCKNAAWGTRSITGRRPSDRGDSRPGTHVSRASSGDRLRRHGLRHRRERQFCRHSHCHQSRSGARQLDCWPKGRRDGRPSQRRGPDATVLGHHPACPTLAPRPGKRGDHPLPGCDRHAPGILEIAERTRRRQAARARHRAQRIGAPRSTGSGPDRPFHGKGTKRRDASKSTSYVCQFTRQGIYSERCHDGRPLSTRTSISQRHRGRADPDNSYRSQRPATTLWRCVRNTYRRSLRNGPWHDYRVDFTGNL